MAAPMNAAPVPANRAPIPAVLAAAAAFLVTASFLGLGTAGAAAADAATSMSTNGSAIRPIAVTRATSATANSPVSVATVASVRSSASWPRYTAIAIVRVLIAGHGGLSLGAVMRPERLAAAAARGVPAAAADPLTGPTFIMAVLSA